MEDRLPGEDDEDCSSGSQGNRRAVRSPPARIMKIARKSREELKKEKSPSPSMAQVI
jgi:hypothetical protein